jgi:GT2 family glycosyltransferase
LIWIMTSDRPRPAVGPAIGIVIVNFNGGRLVCDTVASLHRQTLPAHRIVVLDNASDDGSATEIAAAFPEVEIVVLDRNIGFAAANNRGIAMLDDCELVGLLNPDAVAAPDWLETLASAAAGSGEEYASFASRIERADGSGLLDSAGDVYHVYGTAWSRRHGAPAASAGAPVEVFGPSGAAALYRREWLVRVGGFDRRYFCYFEDVDLNLRLQVAGGRCLYVPDARVRHVGGASSGGLSAFTIYHSQRNLVWTYAKSMPAHVLWRYLAMHILLNLGSVASYGIRGHTKTLLRAKRDALRGLPSVLRTRRSVMETADFDRVIFDRNMRHGLRMLLRETRS